MQAMVFKALDLKSISADTHSFLKMTRSLCSWNNLISISTHLRRHIQYQNNWTYYCYCWFFCRTTSSMNGNNWLSYYYTVFQIFSRNAVDGTPVQYGDTVAFKYPFGGYNKWLYHYGNRFYARGCSSTSKYTCAKQNKSTGFKIFKKL